MIFFKKQHEDIAIGFLKRVDLMLRNEKKSVLGYSIDDGIETLKLRVGGAVMELKIEAPVYTPTRPEVGDPNVRAEQSIEETKEIIY